MDAFHIFLILFYSFAVIFKAFEVVHFIHQKRLEKRIAKTLDSLSNSEKTLDK